MIKKEFILSELKYRYPEVGGSIRFPLLAVGRPLFYENRGQNTGARIIVCRAAELDMQREWNRPETLYVCIGSPQNAALENLDVCVLPQSVQPEALMNFIQRLFDRLDQWSLELRRTAETSDGADGLLLRAYDMLQNPIWLSDERGHIVAHTEHDDASIPNAGGLSLPDGFIFEAGNTLRFIAEDGSNRMVSQIQSGDFYLLLWCASLERPFYGSDEVVFESLADNLRRMISEKKLNFRTVRRTRANDAAEVIFRSLLANEISGREAAGALNGFGWNDAETYYLITAEPFDRDLRAARANELCAAIESGIDGCCAFFSPPVIAAVARADMGDSGKLKDTLEALSIETGMRFGICEAYRGFEHLPQRLKIAAFALNRATHEDGAVFYSDVAEEYIAEQSISELANELVSLRSVFDMARYDREHDTNYLDSVEAYIRNRFNAVKTAGSLFIHRSTFLYRLERIKAQFGLDLEDERVSLAHIVISIRLARADITDQ